MSEPGTNRVRIDLARGLAVACVLSLAAACSSRPADYTPSRSDAEQSLTLALNAWKAGAPAGVVPDSKPVVQVVDAGRKRDQKLGGFHVLGETRTAAAGRTFIVELELSNPDERLKAQYIIVGIDPIWVFRQEDYELLSHWEHHMPEPSGRTPADGKPDSTQVTR